MRLFEAILEANQRRAGGAADAKVAAADFAGALPIAALTCIDARLNHLLPDALGIAEEHFIWLRNAGNIITGPLSSTMRSLALACAVKGAKEITVIGHTDCLVCKTPALQLLERLAALGVDRHRLPENLVEYFGLFSSERQNVLQGVDVIRASPLIGPKIPVHGLLIDLKTGRLEWVVNGYQSFETVASGRAGEAVKKADEWLHAFDRIGHAAADEFKLPAEKIGEFVTNAHELLQKAQAAAAKIDTVASAVKPAAGDTPPPLTARPILPSEKLRAMAKALRATQAKKRP